MDVAKLTGDQKFAACDRLKMIHARGVLHGDLSSLRNVLLRGGEEDGEIVFCDFGFCKLKKQDHIADTDWQELCRQELEQFQNVLKLRKRKHVSESEQTERRVRQDLQDQSEEDDDDEWTN